MSCLAFVALQLSTTCLVLLCIIDSKGNMAENPADNTFFSERDEKSILAAADKCSGWGFPLNLLDIRMMAKYYLEQQGRIVLRFVNNLPGKDWALSILKRHRKTYNQRLSMTVLPFQSKRWTNTLEI